MNWNAIAILQIIQTYEVSEICATLIAEGVTRVEAPLNFPELLK
ncbi:hypothetical protein [uncultured Sulfitobacter sp.]|nr:hypothetical protein [uncultured Sulfitobacter sp.]